MEQLPHTDADEITLRDLALKLRRWIMEILRYWYIPGVFALLAIGFWMYKYVRYVPVYPAAITFNVDEDEGGGGAGLTGILGQFGLGSVRPSRFNLDKILALSKSRRVIQQSLFAKVTVDGKEDYLANHLLREYKMNEIEKDSSRSSPFVFTHDSIPIFSSEENEMLMALYGTIIGPPDQPKKALMTADYNDDTNIMTLSVQTTNETLSLELADHMFESLSQYYISKSVEKLMKTYHLVTTKRDSVLGVLTSAEYQYANFRDSHRGLLMRTDQLTEFRLQREIAALTAMYGEVIKNVEVADFSVKNKTPFIQVIDTPLAPIAPVRLSLIRQLLKGLLVGGVLGSFVVLGRMFYRDLF